MRPATSPVRLYHSAPTWLAFCLGLRLFIASSPGRVLYVWTNSPDPAAPFDAWSNAAHSIQDALVAAGDNDLVLATNGLYDQGGVVTALTLTNRIVITGRVALASVNGPEWTSIRGQSAPCGGDGAGAARCAWLGSNATLSGFTLHDGHTGATNGTMTEERYGGGAWCQPGAVLSNCVIAGNSASVGGGGVYHGRLLDCCLISNVADYGGGAFDATLRGRGVLANRARIQGGGAYLGRIADCTLAGNAALQGGGGCYLATLSACVVSGNTAIAGGGLAYSTMTNGLIVANAATHSGGGASYSELAGCEVAGNTAGINGGGAAYCSTRGCAISDNCAGERGGGLYAGDHLHATMCGNTAALFGGGIAEGSASDSILYFNRAAVGPNHHSAALARCCSPESLPSAAHPLPDPPRLADPRHLAPGSPCLGRGDLAVPSYPDLDGEPWSNPPALGCDEYNPGSCTGALAGRIVAAAARVARGWPLPLRAEVRGHAQGHAWDFSDSSPEVRDTPYVEHAWADTGVFAVTLRISNATACVTWTSVVEVVAPPVRYALAGNAGAEPPYTNWAQAAAVLQDAVDACEVWGSRVIAGDGLYNQGGRARTAAGIFSNRLMVSALPVVIESLNGPAAARLDGSPAPGGLPFRCLWLGERSRLSGFTLRNGGTVNSLHQEYDRSGAGALLFAGATLSNCWVYSGTAIAGGGGVFGGTLLNCILSSNNAQNGGGAQYAVLEACTLSANTSSLFGGAAHLCDLHACEVRDNHGNAGGGIMQCSASNCWLTGNLAMMGGGANQSRLRECYLASNIAFTGGGCFTGELVGCELRWNRANQHGGGAYAALVQDCLFNGNIASTNGGGAWRGSVTDGEFTRNTAGLCGGGIYQVTALDCRFTANDARYGGGSYESTVFRATFASNSALNGGGDFMSTIYQSHFLCNTAAYDGGASGNSTLYGCILRGNHAHSGGGAYEGNLYNCTVIDNEAQGFGGGVYDSALLNGIVYYNQAPVGSNYHGAVLMQNCCAAPRSLAGTGNFDQAPGLHDWENCDERIFPGSPCIDRGFSIYGNYTNDIAGTPRPLDGNLDGVVAFDVGAYEYRPPAGLVVLGTNGLLVADESVPQPDAGTDFGACAIGQPVTHRFALTNTSALAASISGWAFQGDGANNFDAGDLPDGLGPRSGRVFQVTFRACGVAAQPAVLEIANSSSHHPCRLQLTGSGLATDCRLTVSNTLDAACDPPAGPKVYPAFTVLTNWIEAELSSDTTQWVCSGWAMTAHDPATGATARFVMTLTNDTTLSWLWQTHYWLDIAAGAHGTVGTTSAWQAASALVMLVAAPDPWYAFDRWTGDVPAESATNNPLALPMSCARRVEAAFVELRTTNWDVPLHWLADHGWTSNFEQVVTQDSDHDGMPTGPEYRADTDPTNRESVLQFRAVGLAGGLQLLWTGGQDATQFLEWAPGLDQQPWSVAFTNVPPTPITNLWSVSVLPSQPFYRIRAMR